MEMEGNKKSRHRGENWSEEEKTLFLDIMKDSAKIVDNKLTDTNTNKQKSLEWFHVQSKLRKLTGKNRDIAQLKGFWRRTKTSAKKCSSGYYRVLNVSDETYKPPSPSQEDPLIITVCPMDFINDANECESDGTSAKEVRGKRPFKIWDSSRNVRKGLVVTSFEELIHRGKEKLSVGAGEPVRLVLESDGTQVEDGDYWRTLPPNTVLLLLRQGERWYPTGVDVIKAAISAIPKIVCETIHALELHDETPSWKIMDNKGRVTVVLHWDQRPAASPAARSPSRQPKPDRRPSLVIQTSLERPQPPPPHITVVNHDEPGPARARLTRAPGSLEHHPPPHVHTAECRAGSTSPAQHSHAPTHRQPQDECDFHCCALHEEGRRIAVHKSVATSPIQDAQPRASPQGRPKGHVRFLDAESARRGDRDSSESETENTLVEDEAVTSEKFLLLIDQLSVDQKRHLTIKDIGIILERLSSKILDVERLDRESESDDCYNWTIKATIRGDALRELGVIYNGNYYAISEHPGYREENEEAADEGEEEEEEDRL